MFRKKVLCGFHFLVLSFEEKRTAVYKTYGWPTGTGKSVQHH